MSTKFSGVMWRHYTTKLSEFWINKIRRKQGIKKKEIDGFFKSLSKCNSTIERISVEKEYHSVVTWFLNPCHRIAEMQRLSRRRKFLDSFAESLKNSFPKHLFKIGSFYFPFFFFLKKFLKFTTTKKKNVFFRSFCRQQFT